MRLNRLFPAVVSGAALGSVAMAAPAGAAPRPALPATVLSSPSYDSAGEAGYSTAADLAGWRFRYISGSVTVTRKMKHLGVPRGPLGGAGLQLCDPNTGEAAQVGIVWNSSVRRFEVGYLTGALTATGRSLDPCTSGGILATSPTALPVGRVSVGDSVSFSLYYNNRLGTLEVAACDNSNGSNFCPRRFLHVGLRRFFEAGAGVQDVNDQHLSYPPDVDVADFAHIHITGWLYHRTARGDFRHGPWQTQQLISTTTGDANGAALVSPDNSLSPSGGAFSVFRGKVVG